MSVSSTGWNGVFVFYWKTKPSCCRQAADLPWEMHCLHRKSYVEFYFLVSYRADDARPSSKPVSSFSITILRESWVVAQFLLCDTQTWTFNTAQMLCNLIFYFDLLHTAEQKGASCFCPSSHSFGYLFLFPSGFVFVVFFKSAYALYWQVNRKCVGQMI